MWTLFIRILKWLFVLILPFVALIRGAIFFHTKYNLGPWPSLVGGMLITFIILLIYLTSFHGMLSNSVGGIRAFKTKTYLAAFFIFGYCIHGLFFISSANMKDHALSKELRQLHPIVRLAVSTVIIIDKDLIITDATRKASDYEKMGLPVNERSLHYRQKDGYAYALDLRTRQRSMVRNIFLQNYFRLMGFRTLSHNGTGPHLHISLKPRNK